MSSGSNNCPSASQRGVRRKPAEASDKQRNKQVQYALRVVLVLHLGGHMNRLLGIKMGLARVGAVYFVPQLAP